MTVEQLRWLAAYNRWANNRLLEASSALTAEERERDLRASFLSLQGTLIHILWGERGWLSFWQTGNFVPRPASGDYPDFAALRSAWTQHNEAYATYLYSLTQPELDSPRTLDTTTYTLGELIQHALNHSTYHRGQVALLLRQLGHVPPFTDYHDFLAEARAQGGTTEPG
jgi:uncharacterized damage-inducible protein DinB